MRAVVGAVFGRRRRSLGIGRHATVALMTMLRVCGVNMLLLDGDDVRMVHWLARRRGTRRDAGRKIGRGKRRDDIARSAGFPAAQTRENVRSIIHFVDSMLITLGRRVTPNKYRPREPYSRTLRSRSAFPTTDTDERLIARLAMIGDSSKPNTG